MIDVDEALARILSHVRRLAPETVPVAAARGRTLYTDVLAGLDNPGFDVSAMDGYAVRAADVSPGRTLLQIGVSQAGAGFSGTVGPGECARIFTGAPVPDGADAVVMQEETEADGKTIRLLKDVEPGRSIRFRGEDFSRGSVIAKAGKTLDARTLTLIAAGNAAEIAVSALPRIAFLATGDELVAPGNPVGPDQIVASNSVGLETLLAPYATEVVDFGIVPDRREDLGAALAGVLASAPDVLITTGGASVGEHDLVQEMLKANGVDIDFWRIAMRPGKPLMVGRHGDTLVFGLPGNPVSALVTAQIFVVPALCAMAGATPPSALHLPLAANLAPNTARRHYLRGRFVTDPERGTRVDPIRQTDSGHLSSLASADCLIVQAENCRGKTVGEIVPIYRI